MNKTSALLGILVLPAMLTACVGTNAANENSELSLAQEVVIPDNAVTRNFEVEGMYCAGCAYGIEFGMESIDGVYDASVDYKTAKGSVSYDPELVPEEQIRDAADPYILQY